LRNEKIKLLLSSSDEVTPPLRPFNVEELLPPMEVPPPMVSGSEPEFVDEEWLSDNVKDILSLYRSNDEMPLRVPLTAFVRCSRGGQTRALKEIGQRLKSSIHASVIYVSFNEFSLVGVWEEADPLGALCRRIAFAARRDRNATFEKDFANADVKPMQIIEWLGREPRVLLIDELSRCTTLSEKSTSSINLAFFLKKSFLQQENEYYAFSSHIFSTAVNLCIYSDSFSERPIAIRKLPLIRNVLSARKIFNWPELNAGQALFYGLVPAMIHLARQQELYKEPYLAKDTAIDECIKDGLVTNRSVRNLLASFVDGDRYKVMKPLQLFMDLASSAGSPTI